MGGDETVVAEASYGEIRGSVAGDINAVWKTFCRNTMLIPPLRSPTPGRFR
jgi:hypothetical protein